MAWITGTDVSDVFGGSAPSAGLIAHVQALAEVEIGTQTEPVSDQLAAVMVQIVHRFELALLNDDNISQEQLGSYSYSRAAQSGFGLTHAEKKLLKKAIGETSLWVQTIDRGPTLETAGPDAGDSWLEGAL